MKKILLALCCCLFVLSGCSGDDTKKGKVVEIGIEDAFSKMDKKDDFLLLITRDKCKYCHLMHDMLNDTIADHNTVIYSVVMDDSTTEALYADFDKLKTRLDKPGTTPHSYYIKDGIVEKDMIGFDEDEPLAFWTWVKENGLEDLQ